MSKLLCPLSVSLALTLTCGAATQQATLSAHTNVGVFAKHGNRLDLHFVPAGTVFLRPTSVQASLPGAKASTHVDPMPSPSNLPTYRIGEDAAVDSAGTVAPPTAGTTPSSQLTVFRPGPHAVLLRVQPSPARLFLNVVYAGQAEPGSAAGVAVDVGNDGTIDWTAKADGQTHWAALPLANALLPVARIITEGLASLPSAAPRSGYSAVLDFQVSPEPQEPPCVFTPYGPQCGMAYAGEDRVMGNVHHITLSAIGGFPHSPSALVFGLRAVRIPIPGTNCLLLVDPLVAVPVRADANGDVRFSARVQGPLSGTLFTQAASLSPLTPVGLRTSNGLKMDCGQ